MNIILITVFGGFGVLVRYLLDRTITNSGVFPWATLLSNCIGCLLIGIIYGYVQQKHPSPYLAPLAIGFCGGLTTFSSYAFQGLDGLLKGEIGISLSYLILSPIIGLGLVYFGQQLSHQ